MRVLQSKSMSDLMCYKVSVHIIRLMRRVAVDDNVPAQFVCGAQSVGGGGNVKVPIPYLPNAPPPLIGLHDEVWIEHSIVYQ